MHLRESQVRRICRRAGRKEEVSLHSLHLRLRLLFASWERYEDDVRRIYGSCRDDEEKTALMFLDGRFEEVLAAMDFEDDDSGWVPPFFLDYGASLFLMLLTKGSGGRALSAMLDTAVVKSSFTAEDYLMGTGIQTDTPTSVMFLRCFDTWKKNYDIDNGTAELWIRKLGILISRRVESVMHDNLTVYYDECARLIAALGEVIESRGKEDSKNLLMEAYRRKYSRRRSFINELIKYGFRR